MSYKPELTDPSIYTLRRRIPTRPADVQEEQLDQQPCGLMPGQRGHSAASVTRLNSLIARLFPTVKLSH